MDGNVSAVPYIDLLFVMLVIAVRKGKKKKKEYCYLQIYCPCWSNRDLVTE